MTDTLEDYEAELRAKYNTDDRDKMAKSGAAMADGSYPIADREDLENAIHAVGRGGASHDAIRKHVMARAKALGLSSLIPDNWGADGSLAQANSASDLGIAERGAMHHYTETREMPFSDAECRMDAVGTGMTFRGYASIFDSPYAITDAYGEYQETVKRTAFDKTLAQGADVVFLVNHSGAPLARTKSGTLTLRTDGKGLLAEAKLDPSNPRAAELRSMVERQDLDEMSFVFRDLLPSWDDSYTERNLREVSLHHGDVSAVNFGANGATKGLVSMRAASRGLLWPSTVQVAEALKEYRAGSALSGTSMATLKHVLSLVAAADTAVDQAQPLLAELLGVPNPDEKQDEAMHDDDRSEKRAAGEICGCCQDCGPECDGTCCEPCMMPMTNVYNSDTASDSADQPSSEQLALSDHSLEARLILLRLRGKA